jgi:hypothetical protein
MLMATYEWGRLLYFPLHQTEPVWVRLEARLESGLGEAALGEKAMGEDVLLSPRQSDRRMSRGLYLSCMVAID